MISQGTETFDFDNTQIAFRHKDLPALKKAYRLFKLMSYRWPMVLGLPVLDAALRLRLPVGGLIRRTVFDHFCGGESIEKCGVTVTQLGWLGVGTILDYSVESGDSDVEFDRTSAEIQDTISYAAGNPLVPFAVVKLTGLGSFHLLEKINAKQLLTRVETEDFGKLRNRFFKICEAARRYDVSLLIDAEHSWIQDVVDSLALEAMKLHNLTRPLIHNTYQLYRSDKLASLKADYELSQKDGFYLGAKVVRGAYMELERRRAAQLGYQSPIHADKAAVDKDFDEAISFCVDHISHIGLVLGTHNESSCKLAATKMATLGIPTNHRGVYFSQLLGMSDHISLNLAHAKFNVAKYMPYGPVRHVMPYLLRRAQENSSVTGQSGRELSLLKREISRRKR
ncbi:MAG TPA: proline dehydrogenase family protein [Parapedobacter sp.]|nr:proline dehydrogenase family protein [Parapedobacter sp.]